MSFCAICTDEIVGAPAMEPLGKNDALVAVCSDCTTQMPGVRLGPERGYDVREGASQRAISAAADRVSREMGTIETDRRAFVVGRNANDRTPGWILIRVPLRGRDAREVIRSMSHEPWFSDLRVIGTTSRWHLFERPDPKVAAAQRRASAHPLAAIAIFEAPRP